MYTDMFKDMFHDEQGNRYSIWQIIKFIVIVLVLFFGFAFVVNVGTIYENHVLCQRGATQYCEQQ